MNKIRQINPRCYVAGALNALTVDYIKNLHRMITHANKVEKLGFSVFTPGNDHLSGLVTGDKDYDDYFWSSQPWLMVSDCIFIVPESEDSKGVKKEVRRAEDLNIPVFYSLEALKGFKNRFKRGETKPTIIGLAGKKKSGKSLAGRYLVQILSELTNYAPNCIELTGFANGVRETAAVAFGKTRDAFYGDDRKDELVSIGEKDYNIREVLQKVGTDMFRKTLHKDFWIDRLMDEIKDHPAMLYIITDVRFPNEIEAIKERGGIVIKLLRNEESRKDTHESEIALHNYRGFDYHIYNNFSKESLYVDLGEIMKEVYG